MKRNLGIYFLIIVAATHGYADSQLDNPTTLPVSYFGEAIATNPFFSSFSFGSSLGSASTGTVSNPVPGSIFYSSMKTTDVIPGKEYNVTVTSSGVGFVRVIFPRVPGYTVYLDGRPHTTFVKGTAYSFTFRLEAEYDPVSEVIGLRGGESSSFPEDKPIWFLSLGNLSNGDSASGIGFREDALTAGLFETSILQYNSVDSNEVEVIRQSGAIKQVLSPEILVHVDTYSSGSTEFDIEVYPRSAVGSKSGGLWTTTGSPIIVYTIKKYGTNNIMIIREEDSEYWTTKLEKSGSSWTLYDWRESNASGAMTDTDQRIVSVESGNTTTVYYGGSNATTAPVRVKQKDYTSYSWGKEITKVTEGPTTTNPPETSYEYYTSTSGYGWPRAIKHQINPNGGWVKYEYYNNLTLYNAGQIYRIYRPWKSEVTSPNSANTTNCHLETYTYTSNWDGSSTAPASKTVSVKGTQVAKTTWSYNWNSATVNSHTIAQITKNEFSSTSNSLTTITKAYRLDNSTSFFHRKNHSVTYPDGKKESYAYFKGNWNPATRAFSESSSGDDWFIVKLNGQTSQQTFGSATGGTNVSSWTKGSQSWTVDSLFMVNQLSTFEVTVIDSHGRQVLEQTHVYTTTSTENPISSLAYEYDSHGRLIEVFDTIRSVASRDHKKTYSYTAGLKTQLVDWDGTITKYAHNSLLNRNQVTYGFGGTSKYPARVQTRVYDKANQLKESYYNSNGKTILTYDKAGRVTQKSEPSPEGGSLTTTFTFNTDRRTTVTHPNGATTVEELLYDGNTLSVTGTAQAPKYYDYSYNSTGLKTTTKNASSTANGWVEEQKDWLGRVVKETTPANGWAGASSKKIETEYSYDSTHGFLNSRKTKYAATSTYLTADTLYVYDEGGRLAFEGNDLNANGALDLNSNDRIEEYMHSYYEFQSAWFLQEQVFGYKTLNNQTATQISKTITRLTNYAGHDFGTNGHGLVVKDQGVWDHTGRHTIEWIFVDSVDKTRVRKFSTVPTDGAWQYTTTTNGYFKEDVSQTGVKTVVEYDSLGRKQYERGRYDGSTSYSTKTWAYNANNYSSTPNSINDNGKTTTYSYSWSGTGSNPSRILVTDPGGKQTYTIYDYMGLPWKVWGNGTKPVLYGYDSLGRMTSMKTWKTSGSNFNGSSWPNPSGGHTTQWDFEEATGLLLKKINPDSTDVEYTYNELGQVKSRTWARSSSLKSNYQYYDSTAGTSHVSHRTYELKRITYDGDGGVTPDVEFSYNRDGTLSSVTDATGTRSFSYYGDSQRNTESLPAFFGSRNLVYTYEGTSPFMKRSTGFQLKLSSTVEVNAIIDYASNGRVDSIEATSGPVNKFNLGYETGTDWVESVTSANSNTYVRTNYLDTNRMVLDRVLTQWNTTVRGDYNSTFDSRGFRYRMTRSGTSAITADTREYSYSDAGELSGDTKHSGAGSHYITLDYDLIGNRTHTEVSGSSNDTYYSTYTNTNSYNSITGYHSESTVTYDSDGNLTRDGTWYYRYDAENRLYEMEQVLSPRTTLQFTYDYAGRRVRKTVRTGGPSGTVTGSTKFVWNGWTLIAELNAGTGQTGSTLLKTFLWGPDFAGFNGRSGGPGGLLAVKQSGTTYYPVYDAMGNITAYLNSSGAETARYEYLATGYITGQNGSYSSFNFGFSSQYTDRETGLVYYGRRFYDPKHGRFINRDPIGEAGGINLYSMASNNMPNRWDYLGLSDDNRQWGSIWDRMLNDRNINIGGAIEALLMFLYGHDIIQEEPLPPPTLEVGSFEFHEMDGKNQVFEHAKAQEKEGEIIPLDDPSIQRSGTYIGTITFGVGALLYSHGSFEGYLIDPLSKEVVYVKGSVDGFGLQIGYISGVGDVKFEAGNPDELVGETGGIFDVSVGIGIGPATLLGGNITIVVNNSEEGSADVTSVDGSGQLLDIVPNIDVRDLLEKPKVGGGGGASFQGIMIKEVIVIYPPNPVLIAPKPAG